MDPALRELDEMVETYGVAEAVPRAFRPHVEEPPDTPSIGELEQLEDPGDPTDGVSIPGFGVVKRSTLQNATLLGILGFAIWGALNG